MEKKKLFNSREDLLTAINAIKEDKVLKNVMTLVCNTARKVSKYIDKFEERLKDWEDDIACLTVNNNYFTDIEQFAIGSLKSDVIEVCNNMNKPYYELTNIELRDDYTILLLLLK